MPPKEDGKKAKAPTEPKRNIPGLCDRLVTNHPADEAFAKMSKMDTAIHLWNLIVNSKKKLEELIKAGGVAGLLALLEKGNTDDKYIAMGTLQCVCNDAGAMAEVMANKKVVPTAVAMLTGDHDRSRFPAAKMLHTICAHEQYVAKAEPAIPALVHILRLPDITWAPLAAAKADAAMALKYLIENSDFEPPAVKEARRSEAVRLGVVAPLVAMLVSGRAELSGSAAACLRFLALSLEFIQAVVEGNSLRQIVGILHSAEVEQRAYICGILWELAADSLTLQALVYCKAVPALLEVVDSLSVLALKKPKKNKADAKKAEGKKKEAAPVKLPTNWPEVAVLNATGTLHLLSFDDSVKMEIGRNGGIPILVKMMGSRNMQIYENCTGALWNAGLDPNNRPLLEEARAPEFLIQPVPDAWIADPGYGCDESLADESSRATPVPDYDSRPATNRSRFAADDRQPPPVPPLNIPAPGS